MSTDTQSNYIVAAVGDWNHKIFNEQSIKLPGQWYFAQDRDQLNKLIDEVYPRYIFFPHWRWLVPANYTGKYECVCFHMTNLPYGRGGSPLQNLILRGHKETLLTALKMTQELDAGPIYEQTPLSLHGSATEIYKRCGLQIWSIIESIITTHPVPTEQTGTPVYFERRSPSQSEIPKNLSTVELYDFIRMLDAPGYPKAFIAWGQHFLEFENAKLISCGSNQQLTATVSIRKNEGDNEHR